MRRSAISISASRGALRLVVRTPPFHGGNTGSSPVGRTSGLDRLPDSKHSRKTEQLFRSRRDTPRHSRLEEILETASQWHQRITA